METTGFSRWERYAEWPLAAGAALFLLAYAWPILDTTLSNSWRSTCLLADYAIWVLFLVDYIIRLVLSSNRWRYWYTHLHDLAVIALPVLRPLRLLRLLMLLKVLNRQASNSLRGRIAVYVGSATALLLLCASLAILDAERHAPGASITNFGDALWWSAATVTTVGYGDRYPVTGQGRLVAAGLMIGGIALLGTVTASIASWLVERVRETEADTQSVTASDFQVLAAQIEELKTILLGQQTPVTELAHIEPTRELPRL